MNMDKSKGKPELEFLPFNLVENHFAKDRVLSWYFGLKKQKCSDYLKQSKLKKYGVNSFYVFNPIGYENEAKLIRYIEERYVLNLIQTKFFISIFERCKVK